MNSFINPYSYKCLLGPQSKSAQILNHLASWTVGQKHHFTNIQVFDQADIEYLHTWQPSNFHYLSEENLNILKQHFKVYKTKLNSCCIDLSQLAYVGRSYHGIRSAINKNKKLNLTIQDHYNDLNDVKIMLKEWSETIGAHYFRDFSGKNLFFYKNNFHLECHNIFVYDQGKLISFASLSPGEYSSYIIGKALFHQYPGLSEYTDDLAYQKAIINGVKTVNLGQSKGSIADYKDKFPGSYNILHYDGSIEANK
jgi:hypothetical protein